MYGLCRPCNQSNSGIWTKFISNTENCSINMFVLFCPNFFIGTEKCHDFRFSDYKSMENISCHSNQSSYRIPSKKTTKNNTIYVETDGINMYANYQLINPSFGF